MGIRSPIIYSCGFEGGLNTQGTASGIGTIQATGARTGSNGLKLNQAQAWTSSAFVRADTHVSVSATHVGMSAGVYLDVLQTGDKPFVMAHRASTDNLHVALIESGGNWKFCMRILTTVVWTGSTSVFTGNQYVVELYTYNASSGSVTKNWPMRIKVFDNSRNLLDDSGWIMNIQAFGASYASTNACGLGPGHNITEHTGNHSIVYDDVVCTLGPPPNCPKILRMTPNATGTDTAWTGGTNGDYRDVDEATPTGDFNTTAANGNNETHNAAASGLTQTAQDLSSAENILCVVNWIYGKRSGGTTAIRSRLRTSSGGSSGGTNLTATSLTYVASRYSVSPLTSNPWTATGGAETDIDALEFGYNSLQLIPTGTIWEVDQNFLEIVYGPDFKPNTNTTLAEALDTTETNILVNNAALIAVGDIIEIDNEWMVVTASDTSTTPDNIEVTRGKWTTPAAHLNAAAIYKQPWHWRQRGSG